MSDYASIIIPIIALILGAGAALFVREVTWGKVEQAARDILPDELEGLGVKAAMQAYRFVEQKAKSFTDLDNAGKLALAKQVFDALLDFYQHGNLSELAKEALIELEVYAQHQTAQSAPSGWTAALTYVPPATTEAITQP